MEKVREINKRYKDRRLELHQQDIQTIGREVNQYVINSFKDNKAFELKANDPLCLELLNNYYIFEEDNKN